MRYISRDSIEARLPPGWLERAGEKQKEINDLPADERKEAIKHRSSVSIWQDLKPVLDDLLDGKCWYCETKQDRADNAVDHFRPKNRIAECPDHEGYWWLVFDWTNYRYSCTFCNSHRIDQITGADGGKQDHFPLLTGSPRAYSRADDWESEKPSLLDPTDSSDPGLLAFNINGEAAPRYPKETYARFYERAEVSIQLYHLNYTKTKRRRKKLYNFIARFVKEGNRCFERLSLNNADDLAERTFQRISQELCELLSEKAEFSAAARVYISSLRGDRAQWIDALLAVC